MSAWTGPFINGIPALGFGTWPLKGKEAVDAILNAMEAGFRHIDTAQMYGNEAEVGEAVKASGMARADVYIVSKLSPDVLPADMEAAISRSVEALGQGPIDLMLMHWPTSNLAWFDAALQKLNEAQDQGLVKGIGISNCNIALMERAVKRSRHRILANQVEFHPLLDQHKLLQAAQRLGIALEAYSPIARGAALQLPVVQEIAAAHGAGPAEVVLAWILAQGVIPLPMTTKKANALGNMKALGLRLTAAEMARISAARSKDGRMISPSGWSPEWD